jgi:hypothetical protein
MTIKKKFIYLFNNTTNCRGQCLDHIVVFGKLIFVVLGIWDGVVPYRVTDETDDKRLGITGRVVKSEILDISGVTYTKVLYKTKTRLSKIPKRGFWNSKKDNTIYGLDLTLLTNPADLAFLYYYRIMIPSTFTIPSDVSGSGILPLFLNTRNYDNFYKGKAFTFDVNIDDNDTITKNLVNNASISQDGVSNEGDSATTTNHYGIDGIRVERDSNTVVLFNYVVQELNTGNLCDPNKLFIFELDENGKLKDVRPVKYSLQEFLANYPNQVLSKSGDYNLKFILFQNPSYISGIDPSSTTYDWKQKYTITFQVKNDDDCNKLNFKVEIP